MSVVAICLLAAIMAATMITYRNALKTSEETAAARLSLQVESFTNALDKYRLLAPLLARRPDVLAAFSSRMDEDDLEAALAEMVRISGMSDAAEIQLIYLDGTQISTYGNRLYRGQETKRDTLSRADIVQAMQGRLGRRFVDDGHDQFFVFSSAARINAKVAGVISIVVNLSSSQQLWALAPQPIIAAQDNVVMLSNRANWVQRELHHGGNRRGTKGLLVEKSLFGPTLIKPDFHQTALEAGLKYVTAEKKDYVLGWTFYALEPLKRPIYAAIVAFLFATSLSAIALGGLWIVSSRQVELLRQRRKDTANGLRLERRIRERTRELQKTQEGLIHSAKLAAIGQMSTVLNHEYNQPLMAIRTFSENAGLLFQSGKEEKGQENLKRIIAQVDKLSKLSKSLKSFARRPGIDICAVSVNAVVDESVMIMTPKARKCGVSLTVKKPEREVRVMAGHTRLEQVLVNLIANALDAIEDHRSRPDAKPASKPYGIEITYNRTETDAVIRVSDTGPGIDHSIEKSIFEPFVTSKARGVGLGLGLPIAYNLIKGFGGSLCLIDPPERGMATTFEITLPIAGDDAKLGAHSSEEVKPI
ncbi:ATP-binding protein [uncultured Cohaesibacter sp.]|uniref:sensor histidine kinase n=1 Tax=uncultured Cohaesibacter sp. TaxID=1002546 RepID=UPI0029C6E508|nr:ATP-binding protein [uncultured Cohaesibacter sp.]